MVKIYSVLLAIGFVAIIVIVMGGALADNLGHPDRDPNEGIGARGRVIVGSILGFSMGGMAAEFSPLGLTWQVALVIAVVAGAVGGIWVRYASALAAKT